MQTRCVFVATPNSTSVFPVICSLNAVVMAFAIKHGLASLSLGCQVHLQVLRVMHMGSTNLGSYARGKQACPEQIACKAKLPVNKGNSGTEVCSLAREDKASQAVLEVLGHTIIALAHKKPATSDLRYVTNEPMPVHGLSGVRCQHKHTCSPKGLTTRK